MKCLLNTISFMLLQTALFSQQIVSADHNKTGKIIASVLSAQASLKTISYSLLRTDTLVTNDTRTMTGNVLMKRDPQDTLFGFLFRGKKDGDNGETLYDGHLGYVTSSTDKEYRMIYDPESIRELLYNGGGQMIMPDIIKLDTSKATTITSTENDQYYFLSLLYPDITAYDVINRKKIIGVDKRTMLPVSVRFHQETYARTQDLFYQATKIVINSPGVNYDFSSLPFLRDYSQNISRSTLITIPTGMQAPYFSLQTLNGKTVTNHDLAGKVVLLDFWEVWCGPCIKSMPAINELYSNYKSRGLEVFGVVNDTNQLEPDRNFIKRKGIAFETLIGNEQLKKDYKSGAMPMYILINKKGEIDFVSVGFSDAIEKAIKTALAK